MTPPLVRTTTPRPRGRLINQLDDIGHVPQSIRDTRRHRGSHPNRTVDPGVVVPNRLQRDHVTVVLKLLRMCIRQPRKAPHVHPERKVAAFRQCPPLPARMVVDVQPRDADALPGRSPGRVSAAGGDPGTGVTGCAAPVGVISSMPSKNAGPRPDAALMIPRVTGSRAWSSGG